MHATPSTLIRPLRFRLLPISGEAARHLSQVGRGRRATAGEGCRTRLRGRQMNNRDQPRRVQQHMTKRARELRSQQTGPELKLWNAIRNRQLAGLKFRRQHSIGFFVVDFCCLSKKLIIELDGESHNETNAESDRERQIWLEKNGFTVVRFENDDVLKDLDGVLEAILHVCERG